MKYSLVLFMVCLLAAITVRGIQAQQPSIVLQMTTSEFAEDLLQPIIDEYETANPEVQIQLVTTPGFGMGVADDDDAEVYQDNLAAYFSTADIVLVNNDLTPEATRAGYLLDLMPLTRSDPTFDPTAFEPALLPAFEWDGGQWALPISTSFVVVSYIPTAFDAAGLAYPSEAWTLADLTFAAQSLTQRNPDGTVAVAGLTVQGAAESYPALFISLNGAGVYDETALPSSPDFSSAALETVLIEWSALVAEGVVNTQGGGNVAQLPLVIGNPQGGGRAFGNQGAPERAASLLPGGRAGLNVTGYALSRGTQYPEAAYRFLRYLIAHPNAVTASLGSAPAVITTQTADSPGAAGLGAPGLLNRALVPVELEPLIEAAIAQGITPAERRFGEGILSAYSLMQSDGLDARTALNQAQNDLLARLVIADNRAATPISVQPPTLPPTLAPGEITLDFAVFGGGGGPGGGFANEQQWAEIGRAFADVDAQVAAVYVETENPTQLTAVAETVDCFYASSNLVPDIDLNLLLPLDPLTSTDSAFDRNDFIGGVLQQVQVNNQLWALPLQLSPLALRFDADVFNRAGLTLPQGGWRVDEFESALRQIAPLLAEDEAPLQLNAGGQTALMALIAIYGGIPFDLRTTPPTVNFSDPATVQAIQQVLDLAGAGYIAYGGGGPGAGPGAQTDFAIYSNVVNAFAFAGPGGFGAGAANPDGLVAFPNGNGYNAVAFDLGTGYITLATDSPEACYRFFNFIAADPTFFDAMPARYSQLNSPIFSAVQGTERLGFYTALAALIEQPNTLVFPNNVNAGYFGMTAPLLGVFEGYLSGQVIDLEAELRDAEQVTRAYLDCIAAIPPAGSTDDTATLFEQVQRCALAVGAAG